MCNFHWLEEDINFMSEGTRDMVGLEDFGMEPGSVTGQWPSGTTGAGGQCRDGLSWTWRC